MDPLTTTFWILALDAAGRRSTPNAMTPEEQRASLLITLSICLVAGLIALGWFIVHDHCEAKKRAKSGW